MNDRSSMYASPVGELLLVIDGEGALTRLQFVDDGGAPPPDADRDDAALAPVTRQLDEYFAGTRRAFQLTLAPRGTPFQRAVWDALGEVPYGETATYGEIAARVGRPTASRAVGAANGANPIAIVVPCHRVVGANGTLTGYGGGLDRKQLLLELEGHTLPGCASPRTA